MNKTTINIKGMHCRSCELLVEDELLKVKEVKRVYVNQKKGTADIYYYDDTVPTTFSIENAVNLAGYSLGTDEKKSWFTKDSRIYKDLLTSGIVFVVLLMLLKGFGFFSINFATQGDYTSLPVVFLIGLTAGLSTCMALVGGLVLGMAAKFAKSHPEVNSVQKLKPHVFFNLGRIFFFVLFGALIGSIGSLIQFTPTGLGFLTIITGFVMLLMGVQVLEISPMVSNFKLTLPKFIARRLGINPNNNSYSNKESFVLGGLTFFLPCGFTQAMQLYAVSTGSPLAGALTMGVFALGTAPGLLGIGGITAAIKGVYSSLFFKFVGFAVIVLAFYDISSGYNLTGLKFNLISGDNEADSGIVKSSQARAEDIVSQNGQIKNNSTQVLKSIYTADGGLKPNIFTVQNNKPVRIEIDAKDSGFGCTGSITIPGLSNEVQVFRKGKKNVFEFTPSSKGTYKMICGMGMVQHGSIVVI